MKNPITLVKEHSKTSMAAGAAGAIGGGYAFSDEIGQLFSSTKGAALDAANGLSATGNAADLGGLTPIVEGIGNMINEILGDAGREVMGSVAPVAAPLLAVNISNKILKKVMGEADKKWLRYGLNTAAGAAAFATAGPALTASLVAANLAPLAYKGVLKPVWNKMIQGAGATWDYGPNALARSVFKFPGKVLGGAVGAFKEGFGEVKSKRQAAMAA